MSKGTSEVGLLWLAETSYTSRAWMIEHSHRDYYQVYYIREGSGIFIVNGEDVRFESGMFFFLVPGVSHGIRQVLSGRQEDGGQDKLRIAEFKFVVFDQELHEELAQVPVVNRGTESLQEEYYQIFLEAIEKKPYYEKRVPLLFSAWLYQLLAQRQRTGRAASDNCASAMVNRYIDKHYAEDIQLDELAEISGYSKSYLCQIFREDTGMTINAYLNDVRITHAINLLCQAPEMSVAEIGSKCGFNSVSYFTKAFKRIVGIPPGNFRKAELLGSRYVGPEGEVESVSTVMRYPEVMMSWSGTNAE